jgi:hypothetical protein
MEKRCGGPNFKKDLDAGHSLLGRLGCGMTLGCSRLDAGFDLSADLVARHFQVVGRLHADPEFDAGAIITREP